MRRLWGALLAFAVIATLILAGSYLAGYRWQDLANLGTPRNVLQEDGREILIPHPEGPANRRLAAVEADGLGAYEFAHVDQGIPVRFDPCRRVDWVVAPEGMPQFAEPLIFAAFDEVQSRTGLQFNYSGTTDERVSFERPVIQDRYGNGYAPIIVGWSTEQAHPDLEGPVGGVGVSFAVHGAFGDQRYLRSGVVMLDSADFRTMLAGTSGEAQAKALIMHEIAHVIGLAHVDDPRELMYETNDFQTTWGPGDLSGLAIAGSGPCEP